MGGTDEKLNPQNEPDPNLLFVEETSRYRLHFKLQKEQMECLAEIEIFPVEPDVETDLSEDHGDKGDLETDECQVDPDMDSDLPPIPPPEKPVPVLSPPDLFWFLQQNNMIQTIDYEAVYNFCATIDLGRTPEPTVLAKGIEPKSGADGWFELMVKTSGENTEFEEDDGGKVDLRTLNAYSEIEPGQKLGMVHSPKDGTPGMTAQGLPIPAERGQPFKLIAGEGVILKYLDRVAFAEKSGRALLEKQFLSVVDQLVVPGDVDLSIGNIDFNGFVEVKGDVLDDFDIRSTKGIKVNGHIGACHIESKGSIEIASMAGKEVGRITCRGDLHAGFLNQVIVNCYGDVYVTNEIRNSLIKSTGRIIVERGSIIGGHCIALEGIEAKILGTGSGQKTRVTAGIYFPDADRFDYLREQLKNINQQIESISQGVKPIKQAQKLGAEIAPAVIKRLAILEEKLSSLHEEKKQFSAEIASSTPQDLQTKNPKINVLKSLKEGVSVTLGKTTTEIKIERSGPMSIIENSRDGGLRYLGLSPLPVFAAIIEKDILSEPAQDPETAQTQNKKS